MNTETMGIRTNILVECLVHMVVEEGVDVVVVEVLITIEETTPIMKGRTLVMGADGVLIIQRILMMV